MVKFMHQVSSIVIIFGLLHGHNAEYFFYDFPIANMTDIPRDSYFCTMFEVPYEEVYITDFIEFGDVSNMNHVLLYKGTNTPRNIGDIWECEDTTLNAPPEAGKWEILGVSVHNKKQQFIDYGDNVGREIGTKSGFKYVAMQMHFDYPPSEDRYYGIRFNVTDVKPELLGHMIAFQMDQTNFIPPHSTKIIDTSLEMTSDVEGLLTQYYWHNHLYGVVGSTYRVRNLSEWTKIIKGNPQYKLPNYTPLPEPYVSIQKGDHIALRFIFQSDSDEVTPFGHEEGQESLIFYFFYTTTSRDPLEWTVHRHINFADMFSDVPEIEANTVYGKYYEPCNNC